MNEITRSFLNSPSATNALGIIASHTELSAAEVKYYKQKARGSDKYAVNIEKHIIDNEYQKKRPFKEAREVLGKHHELSCRQVADFEAQAFGDESFAEHIEEEIKKVKKVKSSDPLS